MVTQKPELLAPAGDLTRLRYALAYGADAVYAGQPAFSLRARENGFRSLDEIAEGIEICRQAGKKFYLTSNVIARNGKIDAFCNTLLEAVKLKPDAFIVADPGVVWFLKKEAPEAHVHLSVQANTTNWLTAAFWAEMGVERVILSRELSLREVLEIQSRLPNMELEVFVHGNVCMAMSGRCMLSNWYSHRDANQGACNNSCRMPYRLYANDVQSDSYREAEGTFFLERADNPNLPLIALDEDKFGTYFMSSRDLCALELIPELTAAGLASFKIEGRTRSVYYLSQVVSAYRQAIDAVCRGESVPASAYEAIRYTDSRGRMTGFGKGNTLSQNYTSTQEKSDAGCVAALVSEMESIENAATVKLKVKVKNAFSPNDTLKLMTPQGMRPCSLQSLENLKQEPVERLHPGTEGFVTIRETITPSDAEYAFLVLDKLNKN